VPGRRIAVNPCWPNTRVQRTPSSASAPRSPLTRHPLGRAWGHWALDDLCELASRGSRGDQGAKEQIEGDGRISSLHLGDSGLAGANELGESSLGQVASLPALPQSPSQREPELNEFGFLFRKSQELAGGADLPARRFEPFLLRTSHRLPHVLVVEPQSTPAIVNHRLWRRGRFLVEDLQNQNGVGINPIDNSPDVVAIPNPKLVAAGSDRWHRARVRKPRSLTVLKSSEQVASLDSRTGGERRGLDFAL